MARRSDSHGNIFSHMKYLLVFLIVVAFIIVIVSYEMLLYGLMMFVGMEPWMYWTQFGCSMFLLAIMLVIKIIE